ncbi:MerR family transcriptional regulator [Brachybacterium sp. DNPG3]
MRVSELSAATGVAVGTIKFYLREKVLQPGTLTSRTSADYDAAHVERIRLIRALTDVGGLGIAQVRNVIAVIDAPDPPRLDVLGIAQHALVSSTMPAVSDGAAGEGAAGADPDCAAGPDGAAADDGSAPGGGQASGAQASRARDWALGRGWFAPQEDLLIPLLDRAWSACEEAGVDLDEERLDAYASAMEQVAAVDVAAVPPGVDGAVRRVVVGTVMIEPVLAALRLLAQREAAISAERAGPPEG